MYGIQIHCYNKPVFHFFVTQHLLYDGNRRTYLLIQYKILVLNLLQSTCFH